MKTDFLQDRIFLDQLDKERIKQIFVKITVLTWKEQPIAEIQGKAISGSLNLDGHSSLRRTANFQMFAEEKDNDLTRINEDLSINRKIKLEIGFTNTIPEYMYDTVDDTTKIITHHTVNYQNEYGKIVWFPLGIFVIFDPVISHQVGTGATISLTLKDKMCLLNGDAGGIIPASVIFSEREDEYEVITHPTMIQIIQEAVNHFGAQDATKIIIQDLDEQIKQVVKYNGKNPLFYIEGGIATQSNTDGTINYLSFNKYFFDYASAQNYINQLNNSSNISKEYTVNDIITYEYGDDVGFYLIDFVYPGQLVCNPGDSVTSVLDKIISVVGNFEYFYDVYGNFHFQEIKNYLNITYVTQADKDQKQYGPDFSNESSIYYGSDFSSGKTVYNFNSTNLITATTNAPKYSNVKNDFVVWGVRKDAAGNEIPIRYHLAIDHKPEVGQKHENIHFYVDEFGVTRAEHDFIIEDRKLPEVGRPHTLYIIGTGNNTSNAEYYTWNSNTKQFEKQDRGSNYLRTVTTKYWQEQLYYQGIEAADTGSAYPYYYTELANEWPKLFNLQAQEYYKSVIDDPSSIDFYLDMIDDIAAVGEYCVDNIGRRSMVVSEDKINCVFEQQVPDIIFLNTQLGDEEKIEQTKQYCNRIGQQWYQINDDFDTLLTIGGSQNSCYERIRDMLYQYTNMNQSISISAIPLYYLEPNTRINVQDEGSGIDGDYMISQISLPLDISSAMNISAYKALSKI